MLTGKTSKELAPSIVTACPVPSIVKLPGEVFAIDGSVLLSMIVPLTLKLILSVPVPAAHVLLVSEVLLFALLIAARKLHSEEVPGSSSVSTVIVLPVALTLGWIARMQIGARTVSNPTMYFSDARAAERLEIRAIVP